MAFTCTQCRASTTSHSDDDDGNLDTKTTAVPDAWSPVTCMHATVATTTAAAMKTMGHAAADTMRMRTHCVTDGPMVMLLLLLRMRMRCCDDVTEGVMVTLLLTLPMRMG